MSRISICLVTVLACIMLLSLPELTVATSSPGTNKQSTQSATNSLKERVRHSINFAIREHEVVVETIRTSFDTGERKVNEYHFTENAVLPQIYTGSTITSGYSDTIVSDTPLGLKGYITYYATDKNQYYYVLYEYDYNSNSLRKVHEGENRIYLEPQLGIFYMLYVKEEYKPIYYSMTTGKKVYTGGKILLEKDFTDTDYAISPLPQTRNVGVYCTDKYQCNYIEYGGAKGKTAKVKQLWMKPDIKTGLSTKAFQASTDVNLNISQTNTRDRKSDWTVVATKNGKKKTLLKDRIGYVHTSVSPERKTLILVTENGLDSKMESSTVHLYDLETLKLIRTYDSPYRARTEGVQWVTEDEYIIEQYFSAPGSFPPSLYIISENKHLKLQYDTYREWKGYWDSFQFSGIFFPLQPVGIKSGEGVLNYKGQPSFYLEGQHYVPLEEFTKAFHIQYVLGKEQVTFSRGQRSSSVDRSSSKLLTLYNQTFIPLGQWNKDLGLKVSETKAYWGNKELLISDDERNTSAAMTPENLAFHASARRIERVGDIYKLDQNNTKSLESFYPDRIDGVVLNFDRTLTLSTSTLHYMDLTRVLFTNQDYTKVLGTLSITDMPEARWGISTAKIPEQALQDGVLTMIIPTKEDESTLVYTLKLPGPFDKNNF